MLSLIPLSDANPTKRFSGVTLGLILTNVVFFFLVEPGFGISPEATYYFYENAPVPCQLDGSCPTELFDGLADASEAEFGVEHRGEASPGAVGLLRLLLISSFLHAGFMHLIGNMLFLWIFGNNIEDYLGKVKYVAFYLLGALASGLAHVLFTLREPALGVSQIAGCLNGVTQECAGIGQYVPSVGASGAVAAVMGAYIVLYPRARVNVLVPIFVIFTVVQLSALVVLGLWFAYQFLIGAPDIAGVGEHSGVAWMAHVGGFVFGALAIFLLGGRPHQEHPQWVRRYEP